MRLGCGYFIKMRRLRDARSQKHPYALDDHTVERLLGASLPADDAPPEYRSVATVLRSLARRPLGTDLVGESQAVAAVAAAVASAPNPLPTSRRSNVVTRFRSAKIAVAALVGGLTLTTGLAMAGALPGAAQDTASSMLSSIGVTTPSPNSHAGDHPNTRGKSSVSTPPESSQAPDTTKGSEISGLATTTDATGVAKGAEISSLASGGASQAGQHGAPSSTPPVSTPNAGGTGTANSASNGASLAGTGTADNASGGHSSAGAGNAAGHKP